MKMYGKKCWNSFFKIKIFNQYVVLPQNSVPRGDLFSITTNIVSSIFRLLTVTHGQGLMPIKNNTLLINKLHPNVYLCNLMPLTWSENEVNAWRKAPLDFGFDTDPKCSIEGILK